MGIIVKNLGFALLSLALTGWLGCSASEADQTAQVRQAVERYLSARTDLSLSTMRVVVNKVNVDGDRADAAVTIVARNDPQAKMEMNYILRKTAEGWEVEQPQGAESGAHSGGAPSPAPAGEADLPPGHPPLGGEQGGGAAELPPGHPPVEN
jgi:hypothetical protein